MTDIESPGGRGVFTDTSGIKRRTIMTGAAWSIPVIALATATPAMAASGDLSLAFDKSSYSGDSCSTITGAKVTATQSGQPAVGQSVTVSLPSGWAFSDGSTSVTKVTESDGTITLPDIKVPAGNNNQTMTATSGNANTSAGLSSSDSKAKAYLSIGARSTTEQTNVPGTATPVGNSYWLDNGTLYYNNGTVIATGVNAARGYTDAQGRNDVNFTTANGAYLHINGGSTTQQTGVPSSATPVGNSYWLDNGTLYYNNGTVIATGVNAANAYTDDQGRNDVNFTTANGAYLHINGGSTTQQTGVPSSATPVGNSYWLDNGTLYYNNGTVVATGVSKARGYTDAQGLNDANFIAGSTC